MCLTPLDLFFFLTVFLICQSPPKGATIPYRPKPASAPVIFTSAQVRADPLAAQSTPNLSLLLQHQPLPVSTYIEFMSVYTGFVFGGCTNS